MRAWCRSLGRRCATRYHDGLCRSDISQTLWGGSGQPGPELQTHPVGEGARPDPNQLAFVDMDLSDARHPRAHGRAEVLRQIAADDDAVERRKHRDACELLLDQCKLRFDLRQLRPENLDLRALVLGHGLAVLALELLALADQLDPLELLRTVFEAPDRLAGLHQVAGP